MNKFKIWWNTPPDASAKFFTWIRIIYQNLFPCIHEWKHPELIVHGESRGEDPYHRKCIWCGRTEFKCYNSYGAIRYTWVKSLL